MFLVVLPSCWQRVTGDTPKEKSLYVINLLDEQLYTDCHIKGSVNVPLDQLTSFVSSLEKDSEIVVYCSNYMCGSSHLAYEELVASGFTNVWVYEGGMAQWYQLGYPVEGLCAQKYLKLVIEQPNNKQKGSVHYEYTDRDVVSTNVITADKLYKKMYDAAA